MWGSRLRERYLWGFVSLNQCCRQAIFKYMQLVILQFTQKYVEYRFLNILLRNKLGPFFFYFNSTDIKKKCQIKNFKLK